MRIYTYSGKSAGKSEVVHLRVLPSVRLLSKSRAQHARLRSRIGGCWQACGHLRLGIPVRYWLSPPIASHG